MNSIDPQEDAPDQEAFALPLDTDQELREYFQIFNESGLEAGELFVVVAKTS
jgi:hypothetical protein